MYFFISFVILIFIVPIFLGVKYFFIEQKKTKKQDVDLYSQLSFFLKSQNKFTESREILYKIKQEFNIKKGDTEKFSATNSETANLKLKQNLNYLKEKLILNEISDFLNSEREDLLKKRDTNNTSSNINDSNISHEEKKIDKIDRVSEKLKKERQLQEQLDSNLKFKNFISKIQSKNIGL